MESSDHAQLPKTDEQVLIKQHDEDEKKEEKQQHEKKEELNNLETTDTESENEAYYEGYEPEPEQEKSDKENEPEHTEAQAELVHWRINFRNRNLVSSDSIVVDITSPVEESTTDPFSQFNRGPNGEVLARNFQFRHELKDNTYKNKYVLQLDSYKMTFSERDDSLLIRNEGDATVHRGIPNNTLFRSRNMAMEELRKMLSLKLRVWRSLFVSNRSKQMGEMELSKYVNTIAAENLTIVMDSYPNVVQIVKLHSPELKKFTLICCDTFGDILELEQIRNVPNLKLDGPSQIDDGQLISIKANNFELTSEKITSKGLNEFIKIRLSGDVSDDYFAAVSCHHGRWEPSEVLRDLDFIAYQNQAEYVEKNGMMPINIFDADLVTMATNKPNERLVVIINKYFFECFKESKKPNLLSHDIAEIS